MEHILSSIKRIIAEDGEGAATDRRERRPQRMPLARPVPEASEDDVLELSQPIADADEEDAPEAEMTPQAAPAAVPAAAAPAPEPQPAEEESDAPELVSPHTVAASKTSLDALSRLVVRPEVTGSDTLEGMVRDMLRPMLAEWLEANLPEIVDRLVAREIARITGR